MSGTYTPTARQLVIESAFPNDSTLQQIASFEATYVGNCVGGRPSDAARSAVEYVRRAVAARDPELLSSPSAKSAFLDAGLDRPHYGDPDFDYSDDGPLGDHGSQFATESDAHAEWHRNSGVPMGTPGCPQDACHPEEQPSWHLPSVGTEKFTWTTAGRGERMFVSDQSDLGPEFSLGRVYADACDVGFVLISAVTGMEIIVALSHESRDAEGELLYTEYKPIEWPRSVSEQSVDFVVRIFND